MQVLKGSFFRIILILCVFLIFTTYQSNIKTQFSIFNIKNINILETKYLEEEVKNQIYDLLINKDLFFLNRDDLKSAISKSEWVEQYSFKKIYPNQINLIIKEFEPIAIQISNNNFYIINSDFRKTKINNYKQFNVLKIIGNPDKDELKYLYNNLLKNNLILNISIAEYKESLRWDLILKNNSRVLLARNNLEEQLEMLPTILNKVKIFKMIDLRFNNRFIVYNYDR